MSEMLTKKQLKDAAGCDERCLYDDRCKNERLCKMHDIGFHKRDCVKYLGKVALLYRAMLERHVWHKRTSDGKLFCIECRNLKENGHTKNCELAAMLKEG